jgi:hypothetical protein
MAIAIEAAPAYERSQLDPYSAAGSVPPTYLVVLVERWSLEKADAIELEYCC